MSRRRAGGFTFIELAASLLIAVTVTLLAVASYRNLMDRSRRLDGRTALWQLASAEERHRLTFGQYATEFGEEAAAGVLKFPARSNDGHYELLIAAADAETFTAQARPVGVQLRDQRCALLQIDATGTLRALDSGGRDATRECWS